MGIDDDADRQLRPFRADRRNPQTMGEIGEMQCGKSCIHVAARPVHGHLEMAEPDGTPRFVEGRDRIETIARRAITVLA